MHVIFASQLNLINMNPLDQKFESWKKTLVLGIFLHALNSFFLEVSGILSQYTTATAIQYHIKK